MATSCTSSPRQRNRIDTFDITILYAVSTLVLAALIISLYESLVLSFSILRVIGIAFNILFTCSWIVILALCSTGLFVWLYLDDGEFPEGYEETREEERQQDESSLSSELLQPASEKDLVPGLIQRAAEVEKCLDASPRSSKTLPPTPQEELRATEEEHCNESLLSSEPSQPTPGEDPVPVQTRHVTKEEPKDGFSRYSETMQSTSEHTLAATDNANPLNSVKSCKAEPAPGQSQLDIKEGGPSDTSSLPSEEPQPTLPENLTPLDNADPHDGIESYAEHDGLEPEDLQPMLGDDVAPEYAQHGMKEEGSLDISSPTAETEQPTFDNDEEQAPIGNTKLYDINIQQGHDGLEMAKSNPDLEKVVQSGDSSGNASSDSLEEADDSEISFYPNPGLEKPVKEGHYFEPSSLISEQSFDNGELSPDCRKNDCEEDDTTLVEAMEKDDLVSVDGEQNNSESSYCGSRTGMSERASSVLVSFPSSASEIAEEKVVEAEDQETSENEQQKDPGHEESIEESSYFGTIMKPSDQASPIQTPCPPAQSETVLDEGAKAEDQKNSETEELDGVDGEKDNGESSVSGTIPELSDRASPVPGKRPTPSEIPLIQAVEAEGQEYPENEQLNDVGHGEEDTSGSSIAGTITTSSGQASSDPINPPSHQSEIASSEAVEAEETAQGSQAIPESETDVRSQVDENGVTVPRSPTTSSLEPTIAPSNPITQDGADINEKTEADNKYQEPCIRPEAEKADGLVNLEKDLVKTDLNGATETEEAPQDSKPPPSMDIQPAPEVKNVTTVPEAPLIIPAPGSYPSPSNTISPWSLMSRGAPRSPSCSSRSSQSSVASCETRGSINPIEEPGKEISLRIEALNLRTRLKRAPATQIGGVRKKGRKVRPNANPKKTGLTKIGKQK